MASYFSLVSKYIEFSNTRTPGKIASMSSHALKTSPRAFAYLRMVSGMCGCRSQEDEVPDRLVNQLNSSRRPFARTGHSARSPDSRFPTVGPSNILAKSSVCSLPRVSICCRNRNRPFGSKSTEVASASKRARRQNPSESCGATTRIGQWWVCGVILWYMSTHIASI